jgi:hypothetical protein
MIQVKLTQAEEMIAARVGLARAERAKLGHYEHRIPSISPTNYFDDISQHVHATGAEIAVAHALGLSDFMPTINSFKHDADIGQSIEVRWTKWLDGHLIVHTHDREADIAILCVGVAPDYRVIGYIPVLAARKPRFKHSKSDSWWVSQINLRPVETLSRSVYATASI